MKIKNITNYGIKSPPLLFYLIFLILNFILSFICVFTSIGMLAPQSSYDGFAMLSMFVYFRFLIIILIIAAVLYSALFVFFARKSYKINVVFSALYIALSIIIPSALPHFIVFIAGIFIN